MKKNKKQLFISIIFIIFFIIWTLLVKFINVLPIGPNSSKVGLAFFNKFFHNLVGVNMLIYKITDWLGLIPLIFVLIFSIIGLIQWIKRRNLLKVDYSILILGAYYIVVIIVYIMFELISINYRPVLINGNLEISYPSSTTMLVLLVMPTVNYELSKHTTNKGLKKLLKVSITIFCLLMIFGRILSGVHWITDVIGGILISIGLIYLYKYIINLK